MRRTFRRHIRKTLAHEVPPILQEANFVFSKGEYGRAGELFEKKKPILPTHCPSCGAAVSSPLATVGMRLRASFSFPSNWFPINSAIVSALHSLNFGPPSVAN